MGEIDRYLEVRLNAAKPKMAWRPGDGLEWQERLRAWIRGMLGGLDGPVPDLEPRVGEPTTVDGVSRRRVRFTTRPGLEAIGYWLEPIDRPILGSILCLPGHGQGVAAIVGLADEPYQANFALQCAGRGYRTLALEPLAFGERRSSRVGPHGWSCEADAKTALMLGETLLGWRVWEAMRGIDWLLAHLDADAGKVAIMGISGGGTVGLWTAALDVRISAAVVSGAFGPFRESILAIDHCLDNFVPGILNLIDMPDLAGLVAPRRLFVESGRDDPIFPAAGFQTAVARAQEIFAGMGVPEQFGFEQFDGEHEFRGERAFEFLATAFGA